MFPYVFFWYFIDCLVLQMILWQLYILLLGTRSHELQAEALRWTWLLLLLLCVVWAIAGRWRFRCSPALRVPCHWHPVSSLDFVPCLSLGVQVHDGVSLRYPKVSN